MLAKFNMTAAAFAAAAVLAPAALAQDFFTIGTGGVTGVNYPAGGAVCRLVNRGRAEHGIGCSVEATGGSVYNVNTLRAGELEFGVVQSDVQYNAYEGVAQFGSVGPFGDLRSVFSLHPEPFTVVARAGAGVSSFDDLFGGRVNVGNPGSGQRATIDVLLDAMGRSTSDFELATELRAAEQSSALCDDQIDAMVYVVGHPSGSIQEATTACDSVLVNVNNEAVQQLVEDNPYYQMATIPGGIYRGNSEDVETFGVSATVVTSAAVAEETVYQLVKAVFDDFDQFTQLHPALGNLAEEDMISAGLSAPLHNGAARYYRERGWIE